MSIGLAAARRLALSLAVLLAVVGAPVASNAVTPSMGYSTALGHSWLTIDSNLWAPSHLSAWSIDAYLATYTVLPPLGHAFKAAEAKYGVNALYLLAHAMHETAFGTSYIARRFHNLFGWNAIDRNPVGMATRFPNYPVSIDFVTGQIADQFLSPWGRFYGGAPTLRGMHRYASDPMWAIDIAQIANGIVLSTLARQGVQFGAPVVDTTSTGQTATITVPTTAGMLPDGLRAAYRFVPIAVVEAGAPTGHVPAVDPPFQLADGQSRDGALRLSADAPLRPGRYGLELELRDSDGTELSEFGLPRIVDVETRVFGSDAVTYEVLQDGNHLDVTVSNVGRRPIPAFGSLAPTATGTLTSPLPTTLVAWLVSDDGTSTELPATALPNALEPGRSWTANLASPDAALLPAILVVRLNVGGAPGRLGGAPPGVFRVTSTGADPAAAGATSNPTNGLPAPSVDPNAASGPNPTAGSGTAPNLPAAAPTVPLAVAITAVTPVDAASRLLLNPDWKPKAAVGSGAGRAALVQLSYLASVDPNQPGNAIVRLSNTGRAALPGSTVLLVTAVPAWGPATDTIVLRIPVPTDLLPGTSVDVGVSLPPVLDGPSTFVVLARLLPSDGEPPFPATLFWLRSGPPPAVVAEAVPAPVPAPAVAPLPARTDSPVAASAPTSLPASVDPLAIVDQRH